MPAHRRRATPAYVAQGDRRHARNPARGLDAHQGAVLLHDGETGQLVAVLNASPVTEIRTAAVSAVATRALARADAERVAILGAGVQARGSRRRDARGARRSRDPDLVAETSRPRSSSPRRSRRSSRPPPTRRSSAPRSSARRRAAREPIVERRWLAPGAHVNAVGSCVPTRASSTPRRSRRASLLRRPPRVDAERGRRLPPRGGRGRGRPGPHQGRARRGARRACTPAARARTS